MNRAAAVESRILPDTPVRFLRNVGEARAGLFATAGIHTVLDFLYWLPYRYEDRRRPARVCDLRSIDAPVVLRGRILSCASKISPVRRLPIFEAILDDGTGTVMLVWFHQPWLADRLHRGDRVSIYGQPRISPQGRLQIDSPDWEKLGPEGESEDEGVIAAVYSPIQGIQPKAVRGLMQQAIEAAPAIEDPLPAELRRQLGIPGLAESLIALHFPQEITPELIERTTPAHRRLIAQEFFAFQLALRMRRASEEGAAKGRTITVTDAMRVKIREILPFRLTGAQKRVLREIAGDLQSERPMYRLLQGEVGSGKTIVALIAALLEIENGHQAALLAPTEILAEQHAQRIRQLVDDKIRVAKLTGSSRAAERKRLLEALRAGEIDLLVGTHALLEKPVAFRSLGLAIVDEQHRFGVAQRQRLFEKGVLPDILVMTATPIPRSLAIALYGDLELSVIDELPPGRIPVRTVVRGTNRLPKVWEFVEKELRAEAQTYVVFPLIEESEKVDLKALASGVEEIRRRFPSRKIATLHGRMSAEEKERTMAAFKSGAIEILVSTTVIEVGIDVPNASVMVILDADRFGLSQLHQLRGRVGRGERQSWCAVVRDETASEEAKQRLRTFEATRDGFDVAEKDLQLRGPGDFFGTRQSGAPRFHWGDILRDFNVMELAREIAIEAVEQRRWGDPEDLLFRLTGSREPFAGRD